MIDCDTDYYTTCTVAVGHDALINDTVITFNILVVDVKQLLILTSISYLISTTHVSIFIVKAGAYM